MLYIVLMSISYLFIYRYLSQRYAACYCVFIVGVCCRCFAHRRVSSITGRCGKPLFLAMFH